MGMDDLILSTMKTIDIREIEDMYTNVEKKFVIVLGTKFQEKWLGVNCGPKLLKTYINWCRTGGNIPVEFFQTANKQFQERYVRILLSTEEFPLLHVQDQFLLLKSNLQLTEILTYIRSNNFATVEEELDHVFGDMDKKNWRQFSEEVSPKRLSDMPHEMPFDTNTREKYINLMSQCQLKIITNQNVFSLMAAILLFSPEGINLVQR